MARLRTIKNKNPLTVRVMSIVLVVVEFLEIVGWCPGEGKAGVVNASIARIRTNDVQGSTSAAIGRTPRAASVTGQIFAPAKSALLPSLAVG